MAGSRQPARPTHGRGQQRRRVESALHERRHETWGDGYDDSDDDVSVPVVRPLRRVPWNDVYAVPGVRPRRDHRAGRPIYGWHGDQRVYGQTADGEPVGQDERGLVILETETTA